MDNTTEFNIIKTVVVQYKHGPSVMFALASNKSLTTVDISKYMIEHQGFDKQNDLLIIVDEIVQAKIYKPENS